MKKFFGDKNDKSWNFDFGLSKRNYIKGSLAKLIAEENIIVKYDKVPNSSFDPHRRVLTLPILKDWISNELYNTILGREAARALYNTQPVNGGQIAPQNPHFGNILYNLTDGIRTEKLLKKKYPGLAKDMNHTYREQFKRITDYKLKDPFDPEHVGIVDRLNAHFRMAGMVNIKFDQEEQKLVDLLEKMETQEDALEAARVLARFVEEPPPQPDGGGQGGGEGEGDGDQEEQKQQGQGQGGDDGDEHQEGQGQGEGEDEGDQDKDANGNGNGDGDQEKDQKDGQGQGEGGDKKEKDQKGGKQPAPPPPGAPGGNHKPLPVFHPRTKDSNLTQQLENRFKDNLDQQARPAQTLFFPEEVNLDNHIIGYKRLYTDIFGKEYGHHMFNPADHPTLTKWFDENKAYITMMVQEFERRKKAALYRRQTISKTGMLETNKLSVCMFSEDIFRRVTTLPEGKNHAMIIIVDWSSSMTPNLPSTLNQLMNLVEFCRRMRIPHEVYAFSDGSHYNVGRYNPYVTQKVQMTGIPESVKAMPITDTMYPHKTKLLQFFSDQMSHAEYMAGMHIVNIMRLAYADGGLNRHPKVRNKDYDWKHLGFGGTPLNDSILMFPSLVKSIRERSHAEIVKSIVLTDGQSNARVPLLDGNMAATVSKFSLTDKSTGINIMTQDNIQFTSGLIELAGKKAQCDFIGIYLIDHQATANYGFFNQIVETVTGDLDGPGSGKIKEQLPKLHDFYKKKGYAVVKNFGFKEYYLMDPKFVAKKEVDMDELTFQMNRRRQHRSMLGQFIEGLAV